MGFFRKRSNPNSQNQASSSIVPGARQVPVTVIDNHPITFNPSVTMNKDLSGTPAYAGLISTPPTSSSISPPVYSNSETLAIPTTKANSPFPIIKQLIALVQDLEEFVELHRAEMKKEEDGIASYECDKPLKDVDIVISFITNSIVPFYSKFTAIFSDPSYGLNPSSAEVKNIDGCYKPLLSKVSELSEEIRWNFDAQRQPARAELRKSKIRHTILKYYQYALQSSTHLRKHHKELTVWFEADDFTGLPLKAQAILLTVPKGRFQTKFIAIGTVTRIPYAPMSIG
ncbi:hypothetical protein F5884DRAFT_850564 [Xylogone sp. PMI_703]|nr:hypothetical protein F5884DRAFT_850564 [Xylogone sp. PMI_703]